MKIMNLKKKIYFISVILFLTTSLSAEVFSFKYVPKSKQKIIATINGKQFQNGKFLLEYSQQYKTIRTIINKNNNRGDIEDIYYFYIYNSLITNQALEIKDEKTIYYSKDDQGGMTVGNYNVFPTLRNTPYFPDKDISPGETWTAPGKEVQDLFKGRISEFPLSVNYTFLGYEDLNGKKVAKFEYEFKIEIMNDFSKNIDDRIREVEGASKTIMYFDNEKGTRVKEEYSRHYAFLINNGIQKFIIEFIDSGERVWFPIELMDKDKVAEELKDQLDKENIEDAEVKKDEKGVKISLENLHFYPDSSKLLPAEKDRLLKMANILKEYKDRGVMIIGHTTDKGTEKGRERLSKERAKVILDYLIKKDAINIPKSSYGGKGGTEPISENSTEEGMKKNRRVEIYILEE